MPEDHHLRLRGKISEKSASRRPPSKEEQITKEHRKGDGREWCLLDRTVAILWYHRGHASEESLHR